MLFHQRHRERPQPFVVDLTACKDQLVADAAEAAIRRPTSIFIEPILPFIEEALDDIQDQTFIAQTEYAFLGEMHEQFQISG